MKHLEIANLQKCLLILNDFFQAVQDDWGDEEFKKKKVHAGLALEHLAKFFETDPGNVTMYGGCAQTLNARHVPTNACATDENARHVPTNACAADENARHVPTEACAADENARHVPS
ncbi:MAG: hypothetical protein GY757_51385 [bacterium]|nr:hypothetical protein [bacterium]